MPSEKQIEAATTAIIDKIQKDGFVGYREAVSIILTALEPAEPASDVEPVAWLMRDQGTTVTLNKVQADEWGWNGKDIQPLYTRPPESRLREALGGATVGRCGSEVTIYCNDSGEADKILDLLILAQEGGR